MKRLTKLNVAKIMKEIVMCLKRYNKKIAVFIERWVSHSHCKQKMMSFRGQANWAKMLPCREKLAAQVCHATKKVNTVKYLTYLSINIGK